MINSKWLQLNAQMEQSNMVVFTKKIDIWLVEYKNSYKSEAFEILDTENIGKNY